MAKRTDDLSQKAAIDEVSKIIQSEQDTIVEAISAGVYEFIKGKDPTECLELVSLNEDGSIAEHLPMKAERRYASALIAFVRKAEFERRPLDSALTSPTTDLVAEIFAARLGNKAGDISEQVIPLLVSSDRFLSGLSASLLSAYSSPVPKLVQRKVASILTAKLSAALAQTIDASTSATIKASIAKMTAATIASPIAVKISASLVMSLTTALKPILLKLLASAAFKAAVVAKIKAIVVGSLLAAFIKIIGVKLGLSAGAVFMWIVIPAVIAWLLYEYFDFPDKLGRKVSESIASEMNTGFEETSRTLADSLVERIVVDGGGLVATHLMADETIRTLVAEAIQAGTD